MVCGKMTILFVLAALVACASAGLYGYGVPLTYGHGYGYSSLGSGYGGYYGHGVSYQGIPHGYGNTVQVHGHYGGYYKK